MNHTENPIWDCYAVLQAASQKTTMSGAKEHGLDAALDQVLAIAETAQAITPTQLELDIKRAVSTGARRYRSQRRQLKEAWVRRDQSLRFNEPIKKVELSELLRRLAPADAILLTDVGVGYSATEIARRHSSSAGAIRTRVSRLRNTLV